MSSDGDGDTGGGRVSLWVDGDRVTADRAAFWAAVDRVEDPIEEFETVRAILRADGDEDETRDRG